MDIIHLLPDSVANQIAAGEVIQRPASCLKELVENSLDAGATRIQVIVRDAGRTLFQVVDNGSGMSETDARMAFERHATSKIRSAQDLFSLRTMGFRGEALASICAVAQVEVLTRRADDEIGTRLEIDGSTVVLQEPYQCPVGTNIKVKNLFYNVPVRRKFLKTDQTELRNLLTEFYHIVLVYPKVQFTFVHNDEILLELPSGTEKQRIEGVFGKGTGRAYTASFVDLRTDTDLVSIRGFVSKPESATRNAQQYFFVNGRYMRHPYFQKAVLAAYSGMLATDYQPSFFIYFDIAPESIDVNIHPTKTEIKFADEQTVFQILMASVREALGKFTLAPTIDFNRSGEIEMPARTSGSSAVPTISIDSSYNPFKSRSSYSSPDFSHASQDFSRSVPSGWDRLYTPAPSATDFSDASQGFSRTTPEPTSMADTSSLFDYDWSSVSPWQYAGKYILTPSPIGLLLIHQHRAHAAVLYAQYIEQLTSSHGSMQQLLFPEILDLSADDMVLIEPLLADLRTIGFDLEQFGKTSYSVNAVPALLAEQSALPVLQHILQSVRETGANVSAEWRKRIALSLSGDTAIPYNKTLSEAEMRDLLVRLFALPEYRHTPDGKRIIAVFTEEELSKRF